MDQGNTSLLTVSHNLWGANSGLADPFGTSTLVGDPLFIAPSLDPAMADFTLEAGSPAINSGTDTDAPATDLIGTIRPPGAVDMGAYEAERSTGLNGTTEAGVIRVYPNPVTDRVFILSGARSPVDLRVLDAAGRLVVTRREHRDTEALDVHDWARGLYVVEMMAPSGVQRAELVVH